MFAAAGRNQEQSTPGGESKVRARQGLPENANTPDLEPVMQIGAADYHHVPHHHATPRRSIDFTRDTELCEMFRNSATVFPA